MINNEKSVTVNLCLKCWRCCFSIAQAARSKCRRKEIKKKRHWLLIFGTNPNLNATSSSTNSVEWIQETQLKLYSAWNEMKNSLSFSLYCQQSDMLARSGYEWIHIWYWSYLDLCWINLYNAINVRQGESGKSGVVPKNKGCKKNAR